jgi:hypothetical protein
LHQKLLINVKPFPHTKDFPQTSNPFQSNFPPKDRALLLRKNHPLLTEINQLILEETVNIKMIYAKYFNHNRLSNCGELDGPEALSKY